MAKKETKQAALHISRHFTKEGISPYDQYEYEMRSSVIRNTTGDVVFEMHNVEVPKEWSQVATDILAQKYFRKAGVPMADGSSGGENSIKQVAHRMADCWRQWGEKHNYFASATDAQIFYEEMAYMIVGQLAAPNSPQWFNTGLFSAYNIKGKPQGHYYVDPETGDLKKSTSAYERPQPHACARYNTKLFTDKGIFEIGEIVENNRTDLKVFDGKDFVPILAVKNNGVKSVYRASFNNGNYIEFTDDHQVFSSDKRLKDGGRYNWNALKTLLGKKVQQYSLQNITPEFALVAQMENEATSAGIEYSFAKSLFNGYASSFDETVPQIEINKAALAGWIVGDGYYGKYNRNNKTTLFGAITVNDDEYAFVTNLFHTIFGTYKTLAKKEINDLYRIVKYDSKNTDAFVNEYGLNRSSFLAEVPEKIMKGSLAEKAAFLTALFQADGTVRIRTENGRNSGDIVLTTISETLAQQVQMLLLSMGIYSNVTCNKEKRENRHNNFHVSIAYYSERKKFKELIGFISSDKKNKLIKLNADIEGKNKSDLSELTVTNIEYICDEEVYDIQTSSAQFAANGIIVHNCFILSVDDDLVNPGGIMDLWTREARIFKYGSGVGTNYSKIRGEGEKLSGGGTSSGLMSFLKIGDAAAGAIKSGGTTRRAAKMVCLDLDHPEIESFIDWKVKEEDKVAALIKAGYSSDYEGEAYRTVAGQNSNNSIRISNKFFEALEKNEGWDLTARSTGKVMKTVDAKNLWDKIAYAAWRCADPGVQYDTTINEWHTCPQSGRINASNPCSEYMFLDNTACNLASINLRKFYDDEKLIFNVEAFEHACRLWTVVLEVSVLMAQFPSKEVAELSYQFRTLGLGFANLGSLLMVSGIPYDSDKARAIAGAITSIMTGISYKTSAEMAANLGAFPGYELNKEDMMRVMRNHRYAAYNAAENYEGLEIKPMGIDQALCPDYLLKAACDAWDDALRLGTEHGYRNAQATVIAPTGTIGLIMDCDTTGVEPDFALVKFKKLSGGGYFKIINQSIPLALKNLGYKDESVQAIVDYAKGTGTLKNAPHVNYESLEAKGFSDSEIMHLDKVVSSAFDISFAFNIYTIGEATLQRIGFKAEQYNDMSFNLLRSLGFTKEQIEAANNYVCGTMTIEGAPFLQEKHYSVFDCANKCGKIGERFIAASGHIRMMGAVQPFISGAISKTINLPHEASVDEIQNCYKLSWELGLKANAIYRDGSKLSQPLSTKSDAKDDEENAVHKWSEEEVLEAARAIIAESKDTIFKRQLSKVVERKKLPAKRIGFTQKAKIGGQTLFVRTGEYDDNTLGEIFIDMHKEGASFRSLVNCFAIAISIGLQYGVPLEEFVDKFTFTRFEPSGPVDHPNIKFSTSIVDYVFRLLAFEYLGRTDLVHVAPEEMMQHEKSAQDISTEATGDYPVKEPETKKEEKQTAKTKSDKAKKYSVMSDLNAANQSMMGDAPSCPKCGNITIRNGTCYKCLNCGESLGCS